MKNSLRIAMLLLALAAVTGDASICLAQTGKSVGGYRETSKTDETVVSSANFAVKTQAQKEASLKLISVAGAERQIVAGSNYRLCLVVNSEDKPQEVTAVVYQNLQNKFSLTSWDVNKCASADANQSQQLNGVHPKTSIAQIAPDRVVKNLYAAQENANAGPFFQTSKRAAVDRYFTKDFADLIWKDATTATDGVGAIDFDPLYHAQDTRITAFTIGKPEYDSNSGVAVVLVSFKNMSKAETVKFLLEQDAAKTWKIMDIVYQDGDMLKGILSAALETQR